MTRVAILTVFLALSVPALAMVGGAAPAG